MTEQIIVRFTFKADRAGEFLFDEGQLVSELQCDTIDEVMEYVFQFDDALTDATALVPGVDTNGNPTHTVVSLTDFAPIDEDGNEITAEEGA